jgi:hypothetical protein
VGVDRGPGIDDIGRIAAYDPRVGARQCQRTGIVRPQVYDTVLGQPPRLDIRIRLSRF